MDTEEPLTRAEARALLAYADLNYRAVTSVRRKVSGGALVLAAVFAVLCGVAAVQWASDRSRLAAIEDRPLVEALGVELPDPRPAIERGQVRVQMLFWGFAAGTTAGLTLLWLGVYWLLRPPPVPPEIRDLQARPPPP
jgi:hypothetical protein